jgi:hypothetical protein
VSEPFDFESLTEAQQMATLIGGAIFAVSLGRGAAVNADWCLQQAEAFVNEVENRYG